MGIIYRVCEALLHRLPVDDCASRVFAETLADWRREPQTLRGLLAVIRAVAGVTIREAVSVSMCRTWVHVLAWSTAWVVLGIGISGSITGYWGSSLSGLATWSVSGFVFFLPTAIVLSTAVSRRHVPVLGLVLVSAVMGLLLVGWGLPAANRVTFQSVDIVTLGAAGFGERPESGPLAVFLTVWPRLSLEYVSGRFAHELPGLITAGPPNGWAAIQLISFSAAFVCLCALMPFIGSALRNRQVWTRRAAMALAVMFVLYRGQIADVVAPDWVLWNFVAPWLPVVVAAAYLITASSAFSATSSTAADPAVK